MSWQNIEITNGTAGELSPRMKGRTDLAKYYNGFDTELNMVSMPLGGVTKRPGTLFVALAKDQLPDLFRARNIPFIFSTVQAYQLELLQGFFRVHMNDAPVVNVQTISNAISGSAGVIRLTVGSTAGLSSGGSVLVQGVGGTLEAIGQWTFNVFDGTHVELNGSAFINAYAGGGVATFNVDIPVPYQLADLPQVNFCQSADVLFLCHPKYPPAKLARTSHTLWTYSTLSFLDGPYLPPNGTLTTLTPSGTAGVVTLTASSTVGINGGQGFLATDVGRFVRLNVGATVTPGSTLGQGGSLDNSTSAGSTPGGVTGGGGWGWGIIQGFTSSTVVTLNLLPAVNNGATGGLSAAAATQAWQLGKWSATTGYPYAPTFWQQRLVFAGTNNQPNAVEASQTGDFANMAPTKSDGTVVANNALSWVISDNQVNAIRWISPAGSAQAMQLGIGTAGSEQIMQAATTSQALTPTNVQVYLETAYGSARNVQAIRIGKSVVFADITGRKLREWTFYWQVNGYLAPDKTQESEHITRGPQGSSPSTWGIRMLAYQQSPHQIIWAIRNDGQLIGFTYDRDQQVWAPHRHRLGGQYYGGPPIVESICTIPSPDGTYDELWLVVMRTINGVPTRFIEVMTRYFDALPQEQAFFVDCGLSLPQNTSSKSIQLSGLTDLNAGNPAAGGVQAWSGNGTLTGLGGPYILFTGTSADIGIMVHYNGGIFQLTTAASQVFQVRTLKPATSLAPAAAGTWTWQFLFTTVSGLAYLNGEVAAILGDGAAFGTQTVAGGQVSLPAPGASFITVGLPYTPVLITMPWEPQKAVAFASAGKAKTIAHLYLRVHETLGFDYGRRLTDPSTKKVTDKLHPFFSRAVSDPMDRAPALFSGSIRLPAEGGYDQEAQIVITQEEPLPLTLLAISAMAEVGDLPPPGA